LGDVEGINKKNGVFEVLKKDNVFYYFGFGARGNLSGIKIGSISSLKINSNFIKKMLQSNNIAFEFDSSNMLCILENQVKIYFDFDKNENNNYVKEILKTEDQIIEKKLLPL
jgi:hypothetical protein